MQTTVHTSQNNWGKKMILFGLVGFLLQFAAVIEALLVWPYTRLDAGCMRSEVQLSIVQCFAIFWKNYNQACSRAKKSMELNDIQLSGLSKKLF